MVRTDRLCRIHSLLVEKKLGVPMETLVDTLEVSRATVVRDLAYLRDQMGAPIVWDRDRRAYRFDPDASAGAEYMPPGLWFNGSEVYALLTMDQMLAELPPGVLQPQIGRFRGWIKKQLKLKHPDLDAVIGRIRVLRIAGRRVSSDLFSVISTALLNRRRLRIKHENRVTGRVTDRKVSPQRLVHYRDNWYLHAWCHTRNALRTFGLNAIETAIPLDAVARDVTDAELDAVVSVGYGIYSGKETLTAVLRFTVQRSRWVAQERWHPEQEGAYDPQGRYVLRFPYSQPNELVMDILRHGAEVEVLEPLALRERVRWHAEAIRALYASDSG